MPSVIYKDFIEINSSEKIVLFLIDGLGYRQWLNYCKNDCGFFNLAAKRGVSIPLTTIFPSTTASAITTINTGLTPQEHGLPEWLVYFKEIDMIIKTLPFAPIDEKNKDKLLRMKIKPDLLFRGKTSMILPPFSLCRNREFTLSTTVLTG